MRITVIFASLLASLGLLPATGILLDLSSENIPDGVDVFHGTFSDGGVYKMFTGTKNNITKIMYEWMIFHLKVDRERLLWSYVETFRHGSRLIVKFVRLHNINGNSRLLPSAVYELGKRVNLRVTQSTLKSLLCGPVSVAVMLHPNARQHPIVVVQHTVRNTRSSLTYTALSSFISKRKENGLHRSSIKYNIGRTLLTEIKRKNIGYTAVFILQCKHILVNETENMLKIHFAQGISIRIDTSSISGGESQTRIPIQRSETSAYADETKRVARSVVESAPCYPRGDDQGASGSSSQQQPGRYIYLLVPRNVTEPADIEKYVTHDANWNTVTYDVESILRMMVTGKEHYDEPVVHNVYLTARLAYVREDSSIVFCTPKSSATAEPPSSVMDTDLAYPSTSYVGTAEMEPSNVEMSRTSEPAVVEPSYARVEREASISDSSRSVSLVVDTDVDDSEASDYLDICGLDSSTPESDHQAASRSLVTASASASTTATGSHGDGVSVIAGQAIGERSAPISAPTDANPDGSQAPPELMRRAEALPLPQLLYRLGPYFNSNLELLVAADYNVLPPPDNRTVAIRRTFKKGVWYTHFAVPPQFVSDYRIAGVVDSRIESQPLFQEPAGALQTTVESFVFSHKQWHYAIVHTLIRGEPAPKVVRRVYAQQVYESHVMYNTLSDMEADVIMRYMNAFRP